VYKNTASQKWTVFAFDRTTNEPIEDDEGQISAVIEIDGVENAVDDAHPTQMTTKKGYYQFDTAQAETNGDLLTIIPTSSTANIQVIGVPGSVYTDAVKAVVDAILTDTGTTLDVIVDKILALLNNRLSITDLTGAAVLRNIGNTADLATWTITDDDTTTLRTEVSWT